MKSAWRGISLALTLLASGHSGRAQVADVRVAPNRDWPTPVVSVKEEMNYLLRTEAQAMAAANAPSQGPAVKRDGKAVMLDPYIVKTSKNPTVVLPPFQTRMDRFLETGNILLRVGKKNLLLSVGGENGRSGSGRAEIALHFSW